MVYGYTKYNVAESWILEIKFYFVCFENIMKGWNINEWIYE